MVTLKKKKEVDKFVFTKSLVSARVFFEEEREKERDERRRLSINSLINVHRRQHYNPKKIKYRRKQKRRKIRENKKFPPFSLEKLESHE